jgi:hypothetical protein
MSKDDVIAALEGALPSSVKIKAGEPVAVSTEAVVYALRYLEECDD